MSASISGLRSWSEIDRMKGFTHLDYAVVIVYLLAIAALGSSFYRRKSTAKDYFLGGKSISWIPAGISIVAADLSAITVMGSPAWSYSHNLQLIWMAMGYLLTAPIVIFVFIPFYARLNLFTAYEYLERRFNLSVRLITSALFQILRGAHVAIALYAPSLVVNLVTGIPVWQCVLYMGAFTTVYTTLGGMKAVIWTDVIQFFAISLGVICVCVAAITHIPAGFGEAYHVAEQGGRLSVLNLSTNLSEVTSLWACLLGGSTIVLTTLTTDQAILQRLFTTKSTKDCTQSIILQALVNLPITLLLNGVGIALFVFYSYHRVSLTGLGDANAILPFFAVTQLPSGVSGLIIAAIFAASMGVMSAGINSLSTATTVDVYQRIFRPNESAEHYARAGRVGTVCWGVVCTVLALFAGKLGELALAFGKVSSFVCGPLLGIFLLGTMTKRTTSRGALIGGAVGAGTVLYLSSYTNWSFLYESTIGVVLSVLFGYLTSFLEVPPAGETIEPYVITD